MGSFGFGNINFLEFRFEYINEWIKRDKNELKEKTKGIDFGEDGKEWEIWRERKKW